MARRGPRTLRQQTACGYQRMRLENTVLSSHPRAIQPHSRRMRCGSSDSARKEGLDGGRETVLYVRCGLVIQKNRSIGMCSKNRGGASSADCFVEGALDNLRLALA